MTLQWRGRQSECDRNKLEIVQGLVRLGADVNEGDSTGCTPIYAAACEGNLDLVRLLYECGADLHRSNAILQWSPFMAACYHGHLDVVRFLHDFLPSTLTVDTVTTASTSLNMTVSAKLNRRGIPMAPWYWLHQPQLLLRPNAWYELE